MSDQSSLKFRTLILAITRPGKPGPKLKFWFANTSTALDPEILLSTAGTNVPFLLFSTAAHKHCLRERLANTFRDVCQSRKRIDEVASTKFEIDPFDVACLIAIAQEQAFQFRTSNLPEIPTHFTVSPLSLHALLCDVLTFFLGLPHNPQSLDSGLTSPLHCRNFPNLSRGHRKSRYQARGQAHY